MDWFYADESDQQQVTTESGLTELVQNGVVKAGTLVWNETFPDWKPAVEVKPKLFGIESTPPLLSPAQRREIGLGGGALPGPRSPTDAVAVCSLVFGCLGILSCFPVFALIGIVCGHIGRKRAREETLPSSNSGISLAGLITGYIGLVVFAAFVAFYAIILITSFAGFSEAFSDLESGGIATP